MIVRMFSSTK
ncbi:Protein of unknown function [Cotesia congregata]|uniref:Uncharacterized protein n=1 Tax=Cotesia congregata TaxID=51543 RepID=A0A8J2H4U1_COTCN|nr:Protein of unknown function [Cotesia congregata]